MKIFLKILWVFTAVFFYILFGALGTWLIISSFGLSVGIIPYLIGPILRALLCYAIIHNAIFKTLAKYPAVVKDPKGISMLEDAKRTIKRSIIVIFVLDYLLMIFLYFFAQ